MAKTTRITRVVGNRGRAFGSPSRRKRSYKRASHSARRNAGDILAYTLATGNPGARKGNMATIKRRRSYKRPGSKSHHRKSNPGTRRRNYHRRRNTGMVHHRRHHYRRNPGTGSIGEIITTSTFVLVGALGSKLGAQLVLGTNNTGVVGYAGNLAVGGALWFLADKVMKNKTAASGVIAGTVAQLILRLINDYTPFGSYVSQLGMGDYQMQSFVTPQILVNPMGNADISIPAGWAPTIAAPAPAPAKSASGGMGSLYGGRSRGLY